MSAASRERARVKGSKVRARERTASERPRAAKKTTEKKKRARWNEGAAARGTGRQGGLFSKPRTISVFNGRTIVRVKAYTVPAHTRKKPKKR